MRSPLKLLLLLVILIGCTLRAAEPAPLCAKLTAAFSKLPQSEIHPHALIEALTPAIRSGYRHWSSEQIQRFLSFPLEIKEEVIAALMENGRYLEPLLTVAGHFPQTLLLNAPLLKAASEGRHPVLFDLLLESDFVRTHALNSRMPLLLETFIQNGDKTTLSQIEKLLPNYYRQLHQALGPIESRKIIQSIIKQMRLRSFPGERTSNVGTISVSMHPGYSTGGADPSGLVSNIDPLQPPIFKAGPPKSVVLESPDTAVVATENGLVVWMKDAEIIHSFDLLGQLVGQLKAGMRKEIYASTSSYIYTLLSGRDLKRIEVPDGEKFLGKTIPLFGGRVIVFTDQRMLWLSAFGEVEFSKEIKFSNAEQIHVSVLEDETVALIRPDGLLEFLREGKSVASRFVGIVKVPPIVTGDNQIAIYTTDGQLHFLNTAGIEIKTATGIERPDWVLSLAKTKDGFVALSKGGFFARLNPSGVALQQSQIPNSEGLSFVAETQDGTLVLHERNTVFWVSKENVILSRSDSPRGNAGVMTSAISCTSPPLSDGSIAVGIMSGTVLWMSPLQPFRIPMLPAPP